MDAAESELLHVTVDLWHPDCWTLETTRGADAGLLGQGTTLRDGEATGEFEVYGASRAAVDSLVEAVRASPLTRAVSDLPTLPGPVGRVGPARGRVLVEFDAVPSIRSAFAERGFLHHGPTRHEDGRERRSLIARTDRPTLRRTLEEIEAEYDADIEVVRVSTAASGRAPEHPVERLTPRQREAFRLARDRGYYEYPRESTARALADELGVSKTTFLEHLRKAEATLLAGVEL